MGKLQAAVGIATVFMGMAVTAAAWMLSDKALFMSLASMWGAGGVSVLVNYFFGSAHRSNLPPQDPK